MPTLNKGQILEDTYEILEEIGAGGGGIVFKSRHLRLQTDVVIKKIKDEIRQKVNLRQEADLLKNLKHPYLPRVYDFIETEDGVYTVMDYIRGEDMDTAIKCHGKYSQKEVKKWAEQLGEVLAYLHSQNPPIIHSDIKPANIMLIENGDICLIDFNISLAAGLDSKTAAGISAGFCPPEQYRDPALYERITHNFTMQRMSRAAQSMGEKSVPLQEENDDKTNLLQSNQEDKTGLLQSDGGDKTELLQSDVEDKTELLRSDDADKTEILQDEMIQPPTIATSQSKFTLFMGRGIDTRSDIYSLGITLYYLLTGIEPPVDFEQRIPVQNTGVFVSEGFALILEKMMELDPSNRYQNGKEFLKAVQNCHKLDKRYVTMYRVQTGIQIASLGCLMLGILLIFAGAYRQRAEKNAAYYAMVQEAGMLIENYEIEAASSVLEQAKQMESEKVGAYEEEIYLLYFIGNYEDCIRQGESYINTIPFSLDSVEDKEEFGNIHFLVGNAYFEMTDYVNAKNLFEYAIGYNDRNGAYYRDYAVTLAKMGLLEEAEEQLVKGIEAGIAQDSVSMVQGELAHVRGEYEVALKELNQTITLTEDVQMKKRAILLCVDIYKSLGDIAIDDEIALLEKYSTEFEEKGNLVMVEYLADAYARKAGSDESNADQYYDKALKLFEQVADRGYMTYQLKENIAILYQNMDRFDEAETALLEMAEEYPGRYEPYKRLAYLEADRQQMLPNIDRSYRQMKEYYDLALERYEEDIQDSEMQMLENMMEELEDGGWF